MAKKARRYFDLNEGERQLSENLFRHDDRDSWVHVASVGVLIRELLNKIPDEYLNREALANRLLQLVLRDNHFYEMIAEGAKEGASIEPFAILNNVALVAKSTQRQIQRILDDTSLPHSRFSLTEQSDEVLKWIDSHPYPFEKGRSRSFTPKQHAWLQQHMPYILRFLKDSSLCPLVCGARVIWPPEQSTKPTRSRKGLGETSVDNLEEFSCVATAPVGLKNAILAYHHSISVKTLSNYLQNRLPKTTRKTPRSS